MSGPSPYSKSLQEVSRRGGIVVAEDELAPGYYDVAAPVFDEWNTVTAAVALSGTKRAFDELDGRAEAYLLDAAARTSQIGRKNASWEKRAA